MLALLNHLHHRQLMCSRSSVVVKCYNLARCNYLACLRRQELGPNMEEKDSVVYSSIEDDIVQKHSTYGWSMIIQDINCCVKNVCFDIQKLPTILPEIS